MQIKKKKKMKVSTEREKAMSEFQRARVLQEASENGLVTCFTCGRNLTISEADGGHGIVRQKRATELEPTNCWPQCHTCNRFNYGEQHKFMEHLSELYGPEEVDRLFDMDDAYNGNEDALLRLTEEDIHKVKMKRDADYYHEQYLYWKKIRAELRYKEDAGL